MANTAIELLRGQFKHAHDWLGATMQGVSSEHAHWIPQENANPIGATYVHILVSEDYLLQVCARETAPLLATTWAGKIGVSELPPLGDWSAWARHVKVDLEQAKAYAQSVFATTDEYLAGLSDDDLSKQVDLSAIGMGSQPLSFLLTILVANVNWHPGEISCLKGLQGLKGYPV